MEKEKNRWTRFRRWNGNGNAIINLLRISRQYTDRLGACRFISPLAKSFACMGFSINTNCRDDGSSAPQAAIGGYYGVCWLFLMLHDCVAIVYARRATIRPIDNRTEQKKSDTIETSYIWVYVSVRGGARSICIGNETICTECRRREEDAK